LAATKAFSRLSTADSNRTDDGLVIAIPTMYSDVGRGSSYYENRPREAPVLRPGGTCALLCFSDRQPGDMGPRRIRQDELREAFRDG
jgi:hypothetical protein